MKKGFDFLSQCVLKFSQFAVLSVPFSSPSIIFFMVLMIRLAEMLCASKCAALKLGNSNLKHVSNGIAVLAKRLITVCKTFSSSHLSTFYQSQSAAEAEHSLEIKLDASYNVIIWVSFFLSVSRHFQISELALAKIRNQQGVSLFF